MSELSKLKWRCRRGIKELDLLLTDYLDSAYSTADVDEQQTFHHLLELTNNELYAYLLSGQPSQSSEFEPLIRKIRSFSSNIAS